MPEAAPAPETGLIRDVSHAQRGAGGGIEVRAREGERHWQGLLVIRGPIRLRDDEVDHLSVGGAVEGDALSEGFVHTAVGQCFDSNGVEVITGQRRVAGQSPSPSIRVIIRQGLDGTRQELGGTTRMVESVTVKWASKQLGTLGSTQGWVQENEGHVVLTLVGDGSKHVGVSGNVLRQFLRRHDWSIAQEIARVLIDEDGQLRSQVWTHRCQLKVAGDVRLAIGEGENGVQPRLVDLGCQASIRQGELKTGNPVADRGCGRRIVADQALLPLGRVRVDLQVVKHQGEGLGVCVGVAGDGKDHAPLVDLM